MKENIVIYDIEIFPNFFVVVFYNVNKDKYFVFELSPRRDDRHELMHFLRTLDLMVGFNNLEFDYPVLNVFIILMNRNPNTYGKDLVRQMRIKSNQIIRSKKRFGNAVRNPAVQQLDLFKMHHFDNVAKLTSLKSLEFVLRMNEIQELPFPPDTILNEHQMDVVIDYCKNKDVRTTTELYKKSSDEIQLREKLGDLYGLPMLNWNDTKIGEEILLSEIKKKTGISKYSGTKREKIIVKDILFPYLAFYSPEFKAIHNWMKSKVLTSTKGIFSTMPIEEVESLKPYVNTERHLSSDKKMTMKSGKILKTLNVVYQGFQYDFGVGGIHGSVKAGVYVDNAEMAILDVDVSSYYPRMSIEQKYYPHHLDAIFCDIYEDIYHKRKEYPKKTPENKGLKLGLNGAYGKSNSEYSELYDPQYTMTTTINGQLSLCMLAEMMSLIPDLKMLQINTDGLTVLIPKQHLKVARNICIKWEQITGLELEYARYTKMVIRDVNNYIAVYKDGSVKRKGAFEYERELHQNHSMLVVPKALEAFFVKGKSVSEFIKNHDDLWDFFKRVKLTGDSRLLYRTVVDDEIQALTRYYVSKEGGSLIKVMPPLKDKIKDREFAVEAGKLCTVANVVNDEVLALMEKNLSYEYYINETFKIINMILEDGSNDLNKNLKVKENEKN